MEGTEQDRLAQGNCVIYSENQEGDERKIFIPALRRQVLSQHCTDGAFYFQTDMMMMSV